ncbi:methyltransferase domain-containing protein [Streptomyces sp. NPDC018031]|uniref:methyltransferase domain-containing protein n=1 Tax=Streptomyces sp. NPDC018031 TaxID=3365033 RepID=UPI0037BBE15B
MATTPRIELDSPSPEAVDGRQIRAVSFQDARLEYVTRTLRKLGLDAAGSAMLVVGGGRGVLPRGLARLGFDVLSLDPSETATGLARAASGHDGLPVSYRTSSAEELDADDAAFDIAYYADTFEVTSRLDQVVAHAARVLRPGGVLLYDTVNRTPLSRLIYLGAFQGFPMTRIMPPRRYAADRLRTPAEMAAALARHGLRNEDVCDFKPKNPPALVKAVLARRRGRITDEEIPPIVDFVLAPDARPLVTYLGYARKTTG